MNPAARRNTPSAIPRSVSARQLSTCAAISHVFASDSASDGVEQSAGTVVVVVVAGGEVVVVVGGGEVVVVVAPVTRHSAGGFSTCPPHSQTHSGGGL
jgi:hypothetical protein